MKHAVADVETNGLLNPRIGKEATAVTRIHSLVIQDLESGQVLSCAQDADGTVKGYEPIEHGLDILLRADRMYFHNGIEFDIPVLEQLYPGWHAMREKVVDTMVACRLRFAHQKDMDFGLARAGRLPAKLIGTHYLKAWGYRLGLSKGDYDGGWEQWTQEMQDYCELDVEVLRKLVQYLRRKGFNPDSMRLEHDLAWYLAQQQRNGWPFDVEKAHELQGKLSAKRETLRAKLVTQFGWWYKRAGGMKDTLNVEFEPGVVKECRVFIPKRDNKKMGYVKGAPCSKLKQVWFNPGSRQHIAKILQEQFDWTPETFTPSGLPEISELTLKRLSHIEEAAELVDYLLVDKRLGQLAEGKQAWFKHVDDRYAPVPAIHHRCVHNGTITHRGAHSFPNLGQVPKVDSPYGPECRELFGVPPGWKQVGADASGLELRMLGHFMARWDDGAYIDVILKGSKEDGTDIHSRTKDILGIESRDKAKTWKYCWLYGGGPLKRGVIILPNGTEKEQHQAGVDSAKKFLKSLPALDLLIQALQKSVRKGYLIGLDGRRVYIRHKHAVLNTLLQHSGSIVVKKWIVMAAAELTRRIGPDIGWDGHWCALGWVHDEVQLAVRPEYVGTVKEILVATMPLVGLHFNLRCPLEAEAKAGNNWKETH